MRPFRLVDAESAEHATSLLKAEPSLAKPLAGGTDLMGEIKEGIVEPTMLVNLASLESLSGIAHTEDGLSVGAMTKLSELENDESITHDYPALSQAVASVATPQIRNMGTLGGNLCQRPRCWYYRSTLFDCRKKGGAICFAINGNSKYHAILGGVDCYIVHPSDLAPILIALGARATVTGPHGTKTLPMEEFFVGPEHNIEGETALKAGELLTRVFVPKAQTGPTQRLFEGAGAPDPGIRSGQRRRQPLCVRRHHRTRFPGARRSGSYSLARIVLGGCSPRRARRRSRCRHGRAAGSPRRQASARQPFQGQTRRLPGRSRNKLAPRHRR